ncbi:MAG: hypothetical protein E3J21_22560 [Anaerolineales bacterium]|nr:MAG: hypothetical protein E3J21_22560 [Anaerolineales bacterium]
MNSRHISRRSFIRVLAGLFAFVPAARSLTAFSFNSADEPTIMSKEELEDILKARIAEGKVLALEGDSIWIRDRYVDKLRLVITDESIVWKGKYNKGNDFDSYPHVIEPGDDVIALGQRNGVDFSVEKMYANILNTYITVDEISLEKDEAIISYTDASEKMGTVKVRPDYLNDEALYKEVVSRRQQLHGTKVQIIGLPLKDGTIVAANVLF